MANARLWRNPAHFIVLFDATAGRVRSTMILPEYRKRRGFF